MKWLSVALASLGLAISALATEQPAARWISAGGALSEWIVELGGADRLVAVDTTSRHLPQLQALPVIGYQRQLAAEGILALAPDVLLGTEEMGPLPVLEQLRNAGVAVEIMPATAQLGVLQANLRRMGELLGQPAHAAAVAEQYAARLQQQQSSVDKLNKLQSAPGVLLLLGHAGASPLAAGRESLGDWLIERAGGRNLASHQGYKALSVEALVALDPEVLLVADRSVQGEAALTALLQQNPALASTRAVRDGRVLLVDPTLLVGGLGPRLPDQLAGLSAAFYPATPPAVAEVSSYP